MKKVVVILLCILLLTGCSVKKVKELTDAEKFATEYVIDKDNPFIYATYDDIDNIFKNKGIIFFATPDSNGSKKASEIINEVAKQNKIEKIYYYNPNKLKNHKSKEYKQLIDYLSKYLEKDENDDLILKLPILLSVSNGNIVGYSNYFYKESQLSEEKLTKKKINNIKLEYKKILNYEKCTNKN